MKSEAPNYQGMSKWSMEFRVALLFFLFLWAYLIIRAFTVFYIHDEIVTKWCYVIRWNPLPNRGFIDANNHFLLSLIAGFFTRLFHSESMFVIRLGSLLAFPIYFWSIYRLKSFFQQKWNFYALFIGLTTAAFLIEFFALARGYGLALAFLVFSLQQMMVFFHTHKKRALLGSLIGWFLAVFASLTLVPFALVALFMLGVFVLKEKMYRWLLAILIALVPLYYFVLYLFELKSLGKLYYGGKDGFFSSTVHSITRYFWSSENSLLDAVLVILSALILYSCAKGLIKTRSIFDPKVLFHLFFIIAIGNIFGQHLLLGVNFPEDRTAIYLVVFFFGALLFSIDALTDKKGVGIVVASGSLLFFGANVNFTHSISFSYEHLDPQLVTLIPSSVKGTPPTTSGRLNMENEMTRTMNLPLRVYQENDNPWDTLVDYMVFNPDRRPELKNQYTILHRDNISGLALLKRKKSLSRTKVSRDKFQVVSEAEFQTLSSVPLQQPLLIRCSGTLSKLNDQTEIFIVISSEDTLSKQSRTYEAVPIVINTKIGEGGSVTFDFSYALNRVKGANRYNVYIWNLNRDVVEGQIILAVYTLD